MLVAGRADDGEVPGVSPLAGPSDMAFSATAVAPDPWGPWIYVAGEIVADSLRAPALVVVDRRTLAQVAVLHSDDQWNAMVFHSARYDELTIVPAPLLGTVFVVGSGLSYQPPSRPAPVYRYDRVP
jgi:hypothetical protein